MERVVSLTGKPALFLYVYMISMSVHDVSSMSRINSVFLYQVSILFRCSQVSVSSPLESLHSLVALLGAGEHLGTMFLGELVV